jgi:site-specific recombinase XerD
VAGVGLAVVRELREYRAPATAEQVAAFETDVLAEFVLARASAGMVDKTIRQDLTDLGQIRDWFGRPLWQMTAPDADAYFGRMLRGAAPATRERKANTLSTYFQFLDLRHRAEIYQLTGQAVQCPLDEINRPRKRGEIAIRVPPTETEVDRLFAGWRADLASCRKFATAARDYAAARLWSMVGLRINESRMIDLHDIKWELGMFGKVHVRHGKGSSGMGPRERLVPLINGARDLLVWFVEDVWGILDGDPDRHGAPLLPSERRSGDGSSRRAGDESLRRGLAVAVERHLPGWQGRLSPHVLRHYCASQLYLGGMDLLAIQELLGHSWVATTMRYVHVQKSHIERAWLAGQQRAVARLEGLR